MTLHIRRHEFNGIATVYPPETKIPRPAQYGVELVMKRAPDRHFVTHALRLVWTKIHTAAYLEVLRHERSGKSYHDRSQTRALMVVQELCHKGRVIAAIYPSMDVAETKVEELRAQDVYGRKLHARAVKIS